MFGISRIRGGIEAGKVVAATTPAAVSAGARNGNAIDRRGYHSIALGLVLGAETGSPSARTVSVVLETSADGSTGWTAFNSSVTQLRGTLSQTGVLSNFDLEGALDYVRVVETLAFTGGSAPTRVVSTIGVLSGPNRP